MLCILYVTAIGLLIGCAAAALEHLTPTSRPKRGIWLAAIVASVLLPLAYRLSHTVEVSQLHAATARLGLPVGVERLLRESWWVEAERWDPTIHVLWNSASLLLVAATVWGAWRMPRAALGGETDPRLLGVQDDLFGARLIVTESAGPAAVGVFRRFVLLPRWATTLPQLQLRYIARHEGEHARRRDAGLLMLGAFTLILLPWNAALWWQVKRLRQAIELDCDQRVLAVLGDPRAYGDLLLSVAVAGYATSHARPGFFERGDLRRRVSALVEPSRVDGPARALAIMAVSLATALALLTPHPIVRHSAADEAMTAHSSSSHSINPGAE